MLDYVGQGQGFLIILDHVIWMASFAEDEIARANGNQELFAYDELMKLLERGELPGMKDLREYLMALPDPTVRALECLMYAGRGDDRFGSLIGSLRKETKRLSVLNMIGKAKLSRYLTRGLIMTIRDGLDLDKFGDYGVPCLFGKAV